ncbi:phage/plasmid primase, P4 family [uncultured Desulfovibrio sp.]|uniref:DNA primase family protein n=1 Tax=uncultured Desulfovibrio sp. TaxID=167968 RepID=UPI0025F611FA|nr:phage/plasmid primase, P4 family [uncultured Desulfovibrio sp.]
MPDGNHAAEGRSPEEIMREQVAARVQEEQATAPATQQPAQTSLAPLKLEDVPTDFIVRCLGANELGDGVLYAHLFQGRHAYIGQADEWIYFRGHHWHVDLVEKAHAASVDVEKVAQLYERTAAIYRQKGNDVRESDKESAKQCDRLAESLNTRAYKLRSQSGRMRCLDFAKANDQAPLAIRGDEIDAQPWSLAVANGVIDLRTGELRPGRPDDYLMKSSPVEWLGMDTPCPTWERFVREVMDDDQEVADFLRRAFGYGITGLSTEHVFIVFHGRGRNGKGIMTEIIQEVLGGRDAASALAGPVQSEMLLDQGKRSAAGPSPDIMALRGLRLAFASETDEGQRFSSARVKWLSGGETLTGRYPHDKRNVNFQPTHLLFLLTNHKPHASSSDFAFWERLLLVDFPLSFVDRQPQNERERPMDKTLKEKLRQEMPGILAWLVRGCLEWQQSGGLKPPPKVRDATSEYRREEDTMAEFVDDCCITPPPSMGGETIRIQASELFEVFGVWYRVNITANPKKQMSQKTFGRLMGEKFQRERKGGVYYYYGVEINHEAVAALRSTETDNKGGDDDRRK